MIDAALELAIQEFKNINLKDLYVRSGATINNKKIQVKYLNQEYLIGLPNLEITYLNKKGDVSSREKVIILHYLTKSKGTPSSGKLIDFRQIPGGNIYYPVFKNRVHRPFLKTFGGRDTFLLEAYSPLGGRKTNFSDLSVKIPVFPKVTIIFILYKGDREFPPACKVLFDSNICDYLSTEDIVVVCEDTVKALKTATGSRLQATG